MTSISLAHATPAMNKIEPATTDVPQVLVLLATYNGERWLDEQLDSILRQQGVRVALFAADDGSSDGTVALIHRRAAAQLVEPVLPAAASQLGAAGNFLRLLREAPLEGVDYVALADQDDIWLPGRLSRAIEQLAGNAAQGYSSDAIAFWADGRRRPLGKAYPQRAFDHLFEPAGPGCTYVLAAPLALALQEELRKTPARFNGIGYHDWLIYAFARTHSYRWVIDASPGVLYRQHADNELGANFGAAGITRRWGRLRSGWFRQQVLQIAQMWSRDHDELIQRLRRLQWRDRLWLAQRVGALRRRPRDQLSLVAMLVLYVLR